jgi:hypothetical protein
LQSGQVYAVISAGSTPLEGSVANTRYPRWRTPLDVDLGDALTFPFAEVRVAGHNAGRLEPEDEGRTWESAEIAVDGTEELDRCPCGSPYVSSASAMPSVLSGRLAKLIR